jgi:hypothetical protein
VGHDSCGRRAAYACTMITGDSGWRDRLLGRMGGLQAPAFWRKRRRNRDHIRPGVVAASACLPACRLVRRRAGDGRGIRRFAAAAAARARLVRCHDLWFLADGKAFDPRGWAWRVPWRSLSPTEISVQVRTKSQMCNSVLTTDMKIAGLPHRM